MRMSNLFLTLAIGAMALPVAAQQPGVTERTIKEGSEPGKASMANVVEATAKVVSIDKATRTVTLKGPKGNVFDVDCGEEVKNFAQIKVGDMVKVQLIQALALELKKTGSQATSMVAGEGAVAAKAGQKPGAAVGRQVVAMANVIDVDQKLMTITLKGPKGNIVSLPVENPEHFKVVKVGDQVEVTYLEAVAIAVEPAPKAEPAKGGDAKKKAAEPKK